MTNRALAEAEAKVTMLLLEVRGTATHERAKLYVAKMTNGRTIAEYLHDEAIPIKERGALAQTLIEILLTRDYSRLPELPPMQNGNGHAVSPIVSVRTEPSAARGSRVESAEDLADDEDENDAPMTHDEIAQLVRAEVRRELAGVLELVAKVLKETK